MKNFVNQGIVLTSLFSILIYYLINQLPKLYNYLVLYSIFLELQVDIANFM